MVKKFWSDEPMSAAVATEYVRRMVAREARGAGDTEGAMRRLEQRFGLPFWSLWSLKYGRAKTVEASLFARIHAAYLASCERQIAALQHELAIERALSPDVALDDLEAEAAELAAKIAAAKARRLTGGRGEGES